MTSAAAVEAMFAAFEKQFGRIDVLVNNPYWTDGKGFLEISEADWDRSIGVCLKGYFLCSQRAARAMVRL